MRVVQPGPGVYASAVVRLCVVLLAASLGSAAPAEAFCRKTTVEPTPFNPCPTEGVPLAWRQACIEYAIDRRGSADLTAAELSPVVDRSFQAWEDVTCAPADRALGFDVREHAERSRCRAAQFNANGPNVNTVAFLDDWDERGLDPSALALTTTWHGTSSGEIFDVDMQVNDLLGPFRVCARETCADGVTDLQSVLTHEAGHFFGLGHSAFAEATMFATYSSGETFKRTLHADDVAGMCAIYEAGSLRSTCDYSACNGLELDCETNPGTGPGAISGCWDDGGCACGVVGGRRSSRAVPLAALALALGLALRRRRRVSGRAARRGRPSARRAPPGTGRRPGPSRRRRSAMRRGCRGSDRTGRRSRTSSRS